MTNYETRNQVLYQVEGVVKRYGEDLTEVRALDGVTLTIDEGEFVVVAGPSGSGKSTLLQLLGGLDRPTSGRVVFEGRDLATMGDGELAELRLRTLGFIFQQFNLIPTLSARENVEVALAPRGIPAAQRRETAVRLLDQVALSGRVDHLPSQLSGGEQQRVAVARALSNEPRVLLADEPTGNLDSATGDDLFALLRRLNDEGQTIVLITHDRSIAERAPRRIEMRDGRLQDGLQPLAGASAG
ncbi:MAG TPA: ABC transporter ATP-binding protein [Thermoleophilaceae bacterium]